MSRGLQMAILRFIPDAKEHLKALYAFVARNGDLFVAVNMVAREDNDKGYPLRFLPTLRELRRRHHGVRLSIHVGEVDDPNAHVRDTLLLGADRIGHGLFPAYHDFHFDSENGVLVMVTGIGTARSAASVMMLGMDSRFDLSRAYWLVAGIAGVDPEDASIGSAAWAEYLVDVDLSHEIDPREMSQDWKYGYIARYTQKPFDENKPEPTGEMFRTNPELTEWAYQLTKDLPLPDFEALDETRSRYTGHSNARRPPFVLRGDNFAAMTFWHGAILNDWANDWVGYWSEGEFVTFAMEDTGTMQALTWLTRAGRAGEEGPAAYTRDALTLLDVSRIDHGVRSVEDQALLDDLARNGFEAAFVSEDRRAGFVTRFEDYLAQSP